MDSALRLHRLFLKLFTFFFSLRKRFKYLKKSLGNNFCRTLGEHGLLGLQSKGRACVRVGSARAALGHLPSRKDSQNGFQNVSLIRPFGRGRPCRRAVSRVPGSALGAVPGPRPTWHPRLPPQPCRSFSVFDCQRLLIQEASSEAGAAIFPKCTLLNKIFCALKPFHHVSFC